MSAATEWLDAAQARADAVGPGAWNAVSVGIGGRVIDSDGYPVPGCFTCGQNDDAIYELADAEFIAAARTDLPAAVAALRAVQAYVDDLDHQFAGDVVRAAEVVDDIERVIATALGVTP